MIRTILIATLLFVSATESGLANADEQLRAALGALLEGDLLAAQSALQPLVQGRPPNRLAMLLLGDVAAIRGGAGPRLQAQGNAKIAGLRAEARARVQFIPWQEKNASAIYRLPESMTALLWVDVATARSYWLEKRDGQLRLVNSFYTSIGSNGAGKQRAWDRRTPIGIYFAVDRLEDFEIHERYGSLAYPLNYPNGWDRQKGRTGDGIWLHGVEASDYARPPRDSDGCVVLTNRDLATLAPAIALDEFAVVISNSDDKAVEHESGEIGKAEQLLVRWRDALATGDTNGLRALYTSSALDSEVTRHWLETVEIAAAPGKVVLDELFLADYPGEPGLLIARFILRIETAGEPHQLRRSLFLRRSENGWLIAAAGYG